MASDSQLPLDGVENGTPKAGGDASQQSTAAGPPPPAINRLNELFGELMDRYPTKGLGTSSMGKFDPIRRWLAEELGLTDWVRQTYAVGSSTAAHNFNSRWVQNNLISGNRVPLGAAFLCAPADENEDKLLKSALNANEHFVDGSRPTSFEAIITFIQRPGEKSVKPYAIQSVPGSEISKKLTQLFPGTPTTLVTWAGGSGHAVSPAKSTQVEAAPLAPELLEKLKEALTDANYQAADDLAARVISSLVAKPFLILAGLSGTGKTLLGLALSKWLATNSDQVQVVAVGADWTSTHHLLGYPDALDQDKYVRTPALELLMRAKEHPELPHFLILDEMNLSHVERYFSDFLSAMETHADIRLHGGPGPRGDIAPELALQPNVFVIGTINVDETTYMFSPKVIDRANVIEFTVTSAAMQAYLDGQADFSPSAIQGLGGAYGVALASAANAPANFDDLGSDLATRFRQGLLLLFNVLDSAGLQFGYRTAREIARFLVVHQQLHGDKWTPATALDAQIAQRLLPRLSGDAARLKPALLAILAFCSDWTPSSATPPETSKIRERANELAGLDRDSIRATVDGVRTTYPITADKIGRMLTRLQEHGFTTAIEA